MNAHLAMALRNFFFCALMGIVIMLLPSILTTVNIWVVRGTQLMGLLLFVASIGSLVWVLKMIWAERKSTGATK